jgi:hypothetical protein
MSSMVMCMKRYLYLSAMCWPGHTLHIIHVRFKTNRYQCLPPTKPVYKEFEIFFQVTLVVEPSLRLECVRLREDFRISRDGPEAGTVRSIVS